jgi:hypothetical protein
MTQPSPCRLLLQGTICAQPLKPAALIYRGFNSSPNELPHLFGGTTNIVRFEVFTAVTMKKAFF